MSQKLGPALWLAIGIAFVLIGYQNCDFPGSAMEPFSSQAPMGIPDGEGGTGDDPGGGDGSGEGVSKIYGISELGAVSGCAASADFPNEILTVTFYINGAAGLGEKVGEAIADQTIVGAGCAGHRFVFSIPSTYRDGAVHELYAYAGSESPDRLIGGAPKAFASYDYSDEGRFFFDTSLSGLLTNSCGSCHGPTGSSGVQVYDYEEAFGYLLRPTPFQGGTANSNSLINQINGTNSHSGGNFCGGGSTVCNLIQQWWAQEFQ